MLENHAYGPTTGLDVEGAADACEAAVELGAGGDVLENDDNDGGERWGHACDDDIRVKLSSDRS